MVYWRNEWVCGTCLRWRHDSQRRFWAQHSVAMSEQCCSHSKECRNNVVMLRCAKKSSLRIVPCNITFRIPRLLSKFRRTVSNNRNLPLPQKGKKKERKKGKWIISVCISSYLHDTSIIGLINYISLKENAFVSLRLINLINLMFHVNSLIIIQFLVCILTVVAYTNLYNWANSCSDLSPKMHLFRGKEVYFFP